MIVSKPELDFSQCGYLSVSLKTASLPLHFSSFTIVRDSSGLIAETSRPHVYEGAILRTRQILIAPMQTQGKQAQPNPSRRLFLSTSLGSCAALSSLLGELLFPASKPATWDQVSNHDYRCLWTRTKTKQGIGE